MHKLKNKIWYYTAKPKMHNGTEMYFIQFMEIIDGNYVIKGLYWALDKKSAKDYIDSLIGFDELCFDNIKVTNNDTQNWILRKVEKND